MPFRKSEAGIGQMLVMPGMVAAMLARAEKVKALAESLAPVDEDGPHPGRYKAAFTAQAFIRPRSEEPPRSRVKHARACGRVTNDSPEAFYVEFGTEKQTAHRVLREALSAAKE